VVSSPSDIFQLRHVFNIHLKRFLPLLPELKIINKLLQSLTLLQWWGLPLPSLLLQILPLRHIQRSPQPRVEILYNREVLFLDRRCNLENRTPSKLCIGQGMIRGDDSTSCHQLSLVQLGVIGNVSGHT